MAALGLEPREASVGSEQQHSSQGEGEAEDPGDGDLKPRLGRLLSSNSTPKSHAEVKNSPFPREKHVHSLRLWGVNYPRRASRALMSACACQKAFDSFFCIAATAHAHASGLFRSLSSLFRRCFGSESLQPRLETVHIHGCFRSKRLCRMRNGSRESWKVCFEGAPTSRCRRRRILRNLRSLYSLLLHNMTYTVFV